MSYSDRCLGRTHGPISWALDRRPWRSRLLRKMSRSAITKTSVRRRTRCQEQTGTPHEHREEHRAAREDTECADGHSRRERPGGIDARGDQGRGTRTDLSRGAGRPDRQRRGRRSRAEKEKCERNGEADAEVAQEQEQRQRPNEPTRRDERPRLRGQRPGRRARAEPAAEPEPEKSIGRREARQDENENSGQRAGG